MPFTIPGNYTINSVADGGPLSYDPETRLLAIQDAPASVFKIIKVTVENSYAIQSVDGEPFFAQIEPALGREFYPLIVVNDSDRFRWRIVESNENEEEFAVVADEGPFARRVWTTGALVGQPPIVLVSPDTGSPQQRFTFTKV